MLLIWFPETVFLDLYIGLFFLVKKQEEKCIVLYTVEQNNQSPINFVSYKWVNWLGMAIPTFNLSTQETGDREQEFLWGPGQPGLHNGFQTILVYKKIFFKKA